MPTLRKVTGTASELVLFKYSDANSKTSNRYCIRGTAVVATMMPTLRDVKFNASELVLL